MRISHFLSDHEGRDSMRLPGILFALMLALSSEALGASEAQKAQTAERKAEVLERKAATGDGGSQPAKSERITPAETQAVDPVGAEPMDAAITCLARAIYWESKGEDMASMEAVANVVMNRLSRPTFPDTICGVVKQGGEERGCQFSWWCDGHADEAEEIGEYAVAKEVARKALNKQLPDRTDGALFFHNKNASPNWARKYARTVQVGAHVFYRPREKAKH